MRHTCSVMLCFAVLAAASTFGFSLSGCQHGHSDRSAESAVVSHKVAHKTRDGESTQPIRSDGSIIVDYFGQFGEDEIRVYDQDGYPLPNIPYSIISVAPGGSGQIVREGRTDPGGRIDAYHTPHRLGHVDSYRIPLSPLHRVRVDISPTKIYTPTSVMMRPGRNVRVELARGKQTVRGQIVIVDADEIEWLGERATGRVLPNVEVMVVASPMVPEEDYENPSIEILQTFIILQTDESGFFETTQLPNNVMYHLILSYHSRWLDHTFEGHAPGGYEVCDCVARYVFAPRSRAGVVGGERVTRPVLQFIRRECACE